MERRLSSKQLPLTRGSPVPPPGPVDGAEDPRKLAADWCPRLEVKTSELSSERFPTSVKSRIETDCNLVPRLNEPAPVPAVGEVPSCLPAAHLRAPPQLSPTRVQRHPVFHTKATPSLPHPREPVLRQPAVEEPPHHLGHHGAQRTVHGLVTFLVHARQRLEVISEHAVER